MKIYTKRIIKIAILLIATVSLFIAVQNVLRRKGIYKLTETPETEIWQGLYNLDKNSVDVFFVGSSHVYNGICTPMFYSETGYTAYNLATSNQDYFVAYYMLREAFKRQKPSVVVLETYGCHQQPFTDRDYDKNTYYKMAFDDMRLSFNKVKAVMEWKKNSPDISAMERLFPVFEYHSRWDDVSSEDFSDKEFRSVLMGYAQTFKGDEKIDYEGYSVADDAIECPKTAMDYLDKIVSLCEAKEIELILVTVPDSIHASGKSVSIAAEAENRDLIYIDYNDSANLSKLAIPANGWRDRSHMNDIGAQALTRGIIEDLRELGAIDSKEQSNAKFDAAVEASDRARNNNSLKSIRNYDLYMDTISEMANSSDYAVMLAARGEALGGLTSEQVDVLSALVPSIDKNDYYGRSFVAIKSGSYAQSDFGLEVVSVAGELPDKTGFELESAGYYAGENSKSGSFATIKINGIDYTENEQGINIVVYDLTSNELVDSCCFATYDEDIQVIRPRR